MRELAVLKKKKKKNHGKLKIRRGQCYKGLFKLLVLPKTCNFLLPTQRTSIQLCPYATLPWSPSEGRLAFAQNFPHHQKLQPPFLQPAFNSKPHKAYCAMPTVRSPLSRPDQRELLLALVNSIQVQKISFCGGVTGSR